MKQGFPFNLYNTDLLALHNILYLAKGEDKQKTIGEVYQEVNKELERRLYNDECMGFDSDDNE